MLGVYLIPHSIHGSELDWSQMEQPAAVQEVPEDIAEPAPE
jgi:hypothetical protein